MICKKFNFIELSGSTDDLSTFCKTGFDELLFHSLIRQLPNYHSQKLNRIAFGSLGTHFGVSILYIFKQPFVLLCKLICMIDIL
jgi:hypothetical protein